MSMIVPAVPSETGAADIFDLQQDGSIAGIRIDGTTAWVSDVSAYVVGGMINGMTSTTADWGIGSPRPAFAPIFRVA